MAEPRATIVWDPRFTDYDFGGDHPFSEASRSLAVRLLELSLDVPDAPDVAWIRSVVPSGRPELSTFHATPYLDFVERAGAYEERLYLDQGDTPAFPGCYEAAARLVGGATVALERTLESRRPAFHPGGGLHHAHPGRASGFCVFNDVAVAIAAAIARGLRVCYLDIDAHHGDGVMYGFYDCGRLLDIDVHQDGRTLFPGTGFPNETGRGDGAGAKVNLPLPPTAGDEALLSLVRRVVPPLLESFRPELIVAQHGVDGHWGDPLARLQYTPEAYAQIDRWLLEWSQRYSDGRLLVTGGGGYRAESVGRVLARTGRILMDPDSVPADGVALPEPWRLEFFETIGTEAPPVWAEPATPLPSRWRPEHGDRLVAELEAAIGIRFPGP